MTDEPAIEARVRRAMFRNVVPLLFGLYAFFSLDRGNVGFAALQMNADLGMSAGMYGLGATFFTIAYLVFQVPAAVTMRRMGGSRGFALVACGWGIASMLNAFAWNAPSFLVVRFLLGFAEAGFGAFVVYYVGRVFPTGMRGFVISSTFVAVPITLMIASPISGVLLGWTHAGLRGWQWLFLAEGAPAVLLGLLCLRFLPDSPETARFLAPDERAWLAADVATGATPDRHTRSVTSLGHAIRLPIVWILGLVLFSTVLGTNTLLFWMPQMIGQISRANVAVVGWLNAVPWLTFAIGMLTMGRLADRNGDKVRVLTLALLIGAGGFVLGAATSNVAVSFLGLLVGTFGVGASMALFWTVPLEMLAGAGLAGALAAVNVIGNSSGLFAHGIIGWLRDHTGGFGWTLVALAGVLVLAALGINLFMRVRPARP